MKLLNPIFDSVFKYLMEDIEIAKGLIAAIIEQEVVELIPQPQEQTSALISLKSKIELQRLDYVAVISFTNQNGQKVNEKILIEVQKSPIKPEIGRFRKYLAEKYKNISVLQTAEGEEKRYLPIKTIYIIDETFNNQLPGVLKRQGNYFDVLRNQEYKGEKDDFVELLTHEAYFIQVRQVPKDIQNTITHLLSVFTPWYRQKDERFIEYPISEDELDNIKDRIFQRMLRKLHGIVENEQLKREMELELEYEDYIDNLIAQNDKALKQKEEAEKHKEEAQKREQEAQKREQEAQKREQEAQKREEQAIINLYIKKQFTIKEISEFYRISEEKVKEVLANNGIKLD